VHEGKRRLKGGKSCFFVKRRTVSRIFRMLLK
jgi:hypothetical protein